MEGNYGVYFGGSQAGKVQVIRQGLYYRFHCRCRLTGAVMCRLEVWDGVSRESLGILVPMGDGFGLDTALPVKRLRGEKLEFSIVPKHEAPNGRFVPIYPDEPFAYIARLKEGFLAWQGEQAGIIIGPETIL